MPGHKQFEHAQLRVPDVEAATAFYTKTMGLAEMGEHDGVRYFGCGLDDNFDLAVTEGESGVDYFGLRVTEARLDKLESRLADEEIDTQRRTGGGPGVVESLAFELPMGLEMRATVVEDRRYKNNDVAVRERQGLTPLDADHITIATTDVRADTEFLRDVIGMDVTEVLLKDDDEWFGTFLRDATGYHDVAFLDRPQDFAHHVAWEMSSIDHMKSFIDYFAQTGRKLESSIHRHRAGNNLAAYFLDPGDHIFEILAEEATVDPTAPTRYTEGKVGYTAWGGIEPPVHPKLQ